MMGGLLLGQWKTFDSNEMNCEQNAKTGAHALPIWLIGWIAQKKPQDKDAADDLRDATARAAKKKMPGCRSSFQPFGTFAMDG